MPHGGSSITPLVLTYALTPPGECGRHPHTHRTGEGIYVNQYPSSLVFRHHNSPPVVKCSVQLKEKPSPCRTWWCLLQCPLLDRDDPLIETFIWEGNARLRRSCASPVTFGGVATCSGLYGSPAVKRVSAKHGTFETWFGSCSYLFPAELHAKTL